MKQLTIIAEERDEIRSQNGDLYIVEKVETPDDHECAGRQNVAREMRENKRIASLVVRKPKGKKFYFGYQFENGFHIFTEISW